VANMAKYPRGSVGHLAAHFERKKNENEEYIKFKNQDIDLSKTSLNYNLAPERTDGQVEFVKQRTSEVRCLKRDDVNVMCSWVVTLPKDYSLIIPGGGHALISAEGHERARALFFERSYLFLADKYGEHNVISSFVHMDENTPHMHFAFVPIVKDKKRDDLKVSAKEAVGLQELKTFHNELGDFLDSFGDWKFHVLNEATKNGNRQIDELKRDVQSAKKNAVKEISEIDLEIQKAKKQLDIETQVLEKQKQDAQMETQTYISLKAKIDDVDSIARSAKPTILGGSVTLKKEVFDELIEAAKTYASNRDELLNNRKMTKNNKTKSRQLDDLKQQFTDKYKEQLNLNQRYERVLEENKKLKTENSALTTENSNLREAFSNLKLKFDETVKSLNVKIKTAYMHLKSAVQGVGMLKHDRDNGYKVQELTEKQGRLIDAIAKDGADWAEKEGFTDIAKEMRTTVGISKNLSIEIKDLMKPERSRTRYDMER